MNTKHKSIIKHFNCDFDRWINLLKEFVEIPGISFDGFDPAHLESAAEFTRKILHSAGLENARLLRVKGSPPYVYADSLEKPDAPTILLYAHYDVQPPMREEKWLSPPFRAVERKSRLYGRGTADDKAGVILHAASISAFIKSTAGLPVNVRVIIDGEEENGSPHLKDFLVKYRNLARADMMVLADMSNFQKGVPTLTISLRGLAAVEIETEVLDHPLHSGMWGGPIPDPVMELAKIISGLTDSKGRIQIPGIYRMVKRLKPSEEKILRELPVSIKQFRKDAGLLKNANLTCSCNEIIWKKLWREPSLVINSIESGGRKLSGNVIMDRAWCRIGLRTPPGMCALKAQKLLIAKIKSLCPDYIDLKLKSHPSTEGWETDTEHKYFRLASQALQKGYGKKTVYAGCGGSIPFANIFSNALGGVPALLVGIEDPETDAHSENESLYLPDFKKAILSQILFFEMLGHEPINGL